MPDNKNGWSVDLSSWTTMEPFETWMDAARQMDIKTMNKIMAGVVKAWPYEGDPTDPAAFSQLHPKEWGKAISEVGRVVGNFFRDTED